MYIINVVDGRTHMKYKISEKDKAQNPWGISIGCNTIQYAIVARHSEASIPQSSILENLYKTKNLTKSILEHTVGIK